MKYLKFGVMGMLGLALSTSVSLIRAADQKKAEETMKSAVAELKPTKGSSAQGTVLFVEEKGGVRVTAEVTGLTPGSHGFHLHEKGDCSAPDGSSAGGHFNPAGKTHGGPDARDHHAGDLGNLDANEMGKAHLDVVSHDLKFEGEHSFVGRAVIVHAGKDDLVTQPTGNAGARVACGVIERK